MGNRTPVIIVTLDADFHTILAVSRASAPSVIRIRMQGLGAAAIAALVQRAMETYGNELASGCMITIKAKKMTCHRLPVGLG